MINQKQITIEWNKAGLPDNRFKERDIKKIYGRLAHNADSELEAAKMFISAIRKAAMVDGKTGLTVENIVQQWLFAGLTNTEAVSKYEHEIKLRRQKGRYGQPIKQESEILAPTSDEIKQQNERWAKELGYENVEAMAKGTHDIFVNLRKTRVERLANKPKTGLTANGNRVLKRF